MTPKSPDVRPVPKVLRFVTSPLKERLQEWSLFLFPTGTTVSPRSLSLGGTRPRRYFLLYLTTDLIVIGVTCPCATRPCIDHGPLVVPGV